jgi:serine/threonine-protein kinase RsbW
MDRQFDFELPNDIAGVASAVEFILLRCETCRVMAPTHQFNVRVSLAEALSNAMIYGNRSDPGKQVRVEVSINRTALWIRISDQGDGFDPSKLPDPLSEEGVERDCGRGIFLMRNLMDEVYYNEQGNAVTLVLRFPEGGSGAGSSEALPEARHEASA